MARGARARRGHDRLSTARLAALTAATGAARSRSCTARRAASSRFPPTSCPCSCRRSTTTCRRKSPLAAAESWVATTCPRCSGRRSARRTRWTRSSTRPGTSSLRGRPQRRCRVGPADRRLLAAGQAVHRRRRARGAAPAVRALLHEGLNDLDLLGFREPFSRLFPQGMIYRTARRCRRRGNVVSPDEAIAGYGADALRLYILYMGPAEQDKEWSDAGIEGTARLLDRIWRLTLGAAARGGGCAGRRRADPRVIARSTASPTTSCGASSSTLRSPRCSSSSTRSTASRTTLLGRARCGSRPRRCSPRPAVRAARRRGAVGAARQRAALGTAVARGGSGARRRGDGRDRRPGERQAS